MKDSTIQSFLKNLYQSRSPITYIITIQVAIFLIITFVGLFDKQGTSLSIFQKLSLATSFKELIVQPWSIITFPFAYNQILPLIFDCLWLYWIGNMFLNLLSYRNFFFVFGGGLIVGAIINLAVGSLFPTIAKIPYHSIVYGIAALLIAQAMLNPKSEINLLLFGNVKFKIIASIFILFNVGVLLFSKNYAGLFGFISSVIYALLYINSVQSKIEWSNIFKRKNNLKVVYGQNKRPILNEKSNQEIVDSILDKISISGYDSLSKKEKETLFKLSKENQE